MIELKNVELWKKSVDAISCFVSEGNFRFTDSGIKFRAMDPSQIVLVDYEMDKKVFDKYSIEPNFVGIDLIELSRVMNRSLAADQLSMDLTDSELILNLNGDLNRGFRLPLIDVAEDEINLPKQEFDIKVEVNARDFKETLKDASLFGSSVLLRLKGSEFFVEASGSAGKFKAEIKKAKVVGKTKSEMVAKYSLNFLSNIVKEANSDKKIVLEMKNDAPIKISYSIGESTIQFYLAHMLL